MFKALLGICALAIGLGGAAVAQDRVTQDRVTLGWGRLFNNDTLGDTRDRWQTGSYTVSRLRGLSWTGSLPSDPGEIVELRLSGRVIAPASLTAPSALDRRYAGVITVGLHSHFDLRGWDTSLGADLVFTGPKTGISSFQGTIHDALSMKKPTVFGNQIGNGVYPTLVAETGRSLTLPGNTVLRPFVEAQVGAEDFVRIGGDLMLGGFGAGALMLRDPVTGQRYQGIAGTRTTGFSYTVGGDVARVFDSIYLPDGGAAVLSDSRSRLRAGVNWQGESSQVFYGVTYLGPEFEAQSQGQFVGSVNLRLRF
ncbi:MAG: lipid A-modifier LpxR family protein [Pseudomonadota bacterium]